MKASQVFCTSGLEYKQLTVHVFVGWILHIANRAMTFVASPKTLPCMHSLPRSIAAFAVVSLAGSAAMLLLASIILTVSPASSTVQHFLLGVYTERKAQFTYIGNQAFNLPYKHIFPVSTRVIKTEQERDNTRFAERVSSGSGNLLVETQPFHSNTTQNRKMKSVGPFKEIPTGDSTETFVFGYDSNSESSNDSKPLEIVSLPFLVPTTGISGQCDLFRGKWVHDPSGPLYTNNSCPIITQMQNCQGNGRPDHEYENWRWQPNECDLPRFDGKKFLELLSGKTLAFIGDSVARNQMESLLCILWQVETPENRGNRRMQRWFFPSKSVTIVRIWSSWLVHHTLDAFDFAPFGIEKIHLDQPDETFMDLLPTFDVVVLSSGHWFAKQSVYILDNEIVGGQLWRPNGTRPKRIDNLEAYRISVETALSAIVTHPNYTGLTIMRSYSPDHYEGGGWNTGGSCTGKMEPLKESELVVNGFTQAMHEHQLSGFQKVQKKTTNGSKLRLMDTTEIFSYRADGHPGPYRSLDLNKITKRSPDGRPPPQDCLHWCMPGPVDTWNEFVLEIVGREFRQSVDFPA